MKKKSIFSLALFLLIFFIYLVVINVHKSSGWVAHKKRLKEPLVPG